MLIAALVMLAAGIILFIFSFFMQNKFKQLDQQIEQLTLSTMQETYTLNKKVKVLEEELLTSGPQQFQTADKGRHLPEIFQRVATLHQQGYSMKEIAEQTALAEDEIFQLIQHRSGVRS